MLQKLTGAQIRKMFIDYFLDQGHTFVRSSSLVPGGDQTLLFTNAGMVQFKDVFLGTDIRPYKRAVNSQKCMRVAGKHNDLEDVGRDDTHHTFFEMLGNWSFGDYYKKEAIRWAWELLTGVYGLEKDRLWASVFEDEQGQIPADDEAATFWANETDIQSTHILKYGRKDNFWEMAETGPCGPCSEIHYDRGIEFCDKQGVPGHICQVNGDCPRYLEIWNLVFIQYNRSSADSFDPLPAMHVDTGMGLERLVAIMQGVDSNYKSDLFSHLLDKIDQVTGFSVEQRKEHFTPYRVIADHARAVAFLIADGVVPGNTGRNYVCRMIIRRAARFGAKLGLNEPFLAKIAQVVIEEYEEAYPELGKNRDTILDNITREETRFQRTVETGLGQLNELLQDMKTKHQKIMSGEAAFDLYATHGLPMELTRDILWEEKLDVDEEGFRIAMEAHRIASGGDKAFGALGGEDVDAYRCILADLQKQGVITGEGVQYDPYLTQPFKSRMIGLIKEGRSVIEALPGDQVEVILPATHFYIESGGQVSDTGWIKSQKEDGWAIQVTGMRKPAAGIITHMGEVIKGVPHIGDDVAVSIDMERRQSIMRNHTATHLLHAVLCSELGSHAQQAGSLVSSDRLRFDFNHPEALTPNQIEKIERKVNQAILKNYRIEVMTKALQTALDEGVTALFGEKYQQTVRTISIWPEDHKDRFSYELCGGTHVNETGQIGLFIINSEGSAAAGVRRIEAVTGQAAYTLVQHRFNILKNTAARLATPIESILQRVEAMHDEIIHANKEIANLRRELTQSEFNQSLDSVLRISGIPILTGVYPNADVDTLRQMADQFRQKYPSGVAVLGTICDNRPVIIAAVTDDLVKKGLKAGELVKLVAQIVGGGGGGKPTLAQAGGKDASRLPEAIQKAPEIIEKMIGTEK